MGLEDEQEKMLNFVAEEQNLSKTLKNLKAWKYQQWQCEEVKMKDLIMGFVIGTVVLKMWRKKSLKE